jgi:3-oxoacyl-[acyl-carrier protein] reductase
VIDTPSNPLTGRVALVTGASRGIGRAVAECLGRGGVDVAVGYGKARDAAEEVAEVVRASGRRAITVGGDMADPKAVLAVVEDTTDRLGPVDILVANAGVGERADLEEIAVEDWDRMLAINLRAPFLLAQAVAPGMRQRRFGRIVFMSSVAAFTGGILAPHYTASKAGLIGLTHALARPLAPHGVTVNAIAPALVETEMLRGNPAIGKGLADQIPVGRLGTVEEVADLTVAVLRNGYITGQTISIDGGLYPR